MSRRLYSPRTRSPADRVCVLGRSSNVGTPRRRAARTTIQDLITRREHKLEAGRQDFEERDGRAHHFHTRAQLEGTLLDRVTIAGRDFARIAQADQTVALTPWQHQFERHVGQSLALLLAHEAGSPMRSRLIRLLTPDHERERGRDYGIG